jgi:type I protein arginine methyltransferase
MYSLSDYGAMIQNEARMQAYARAIADTVKPGDRVLDLGAGPGFCTLLALRAGAQKVIAIDTNDTISLVHGLVRENGFDPALVEVHHIDSRKLTLEAPVDVIIADLRGIVPLFGDNFEIVKDAKNRFLKTRDPNSNSGTGLIPLRDRLYIAAVDAEATYAAACGPFGKASTLGFHTESLRTKVLQSFHTDRSAQLTEAALLSEPTCIAELIYGEEDGARVSAANVDLVTKRSGICHGLALWFEADLSPGVTLTLTPRSVASGAGIYPITSDVYGRAFFPFRTPVTLVQNEPAKLSIFAQKTRNDYVWGWSLKHRSGEEKSSSFSL